MKQTEVYKTVELDEIPKAKSLESVQESERKYYLGQTKIVPFSGGKTVAELRKEYLEQVAADAKAKEAKFAKQIADQNRRNKERFGVDPLANQVTTAVTFGVMAERKVADTPELTPADVDTNVLTTEAQVFLAETDAEVASDKDIKESVAKETKKDTKNSPK